ncbi:MAG: hypothetical protein IT438_04375 [Phycisphaerales bacterium]|nr:hypothetical protein [Phycisphaerales bacterium]
MSRGTDQLLKWQRLVSSQHAELVEAAAAIDPADVAAVERLRLRHDAELVPLALDLAAARRKLEPKWPGQASRLVSDPAGAEMASSMLAANHKAARFRERLGQGAVVLDLCCGVGGDAMGLVSAGLSVVAVDADPVRAWMAGVNARCEYRACDVLHAGLPAAAFHLDPARRVLGAGGARRRVSALEEHSPPPTVWGDVIGRYGYGAIKLGPGLDALEFARVMRLDAPCELEFLSERGRLTQCVAWLDRLAREDGARTATLLTDLGAHEVTGAPVELLMGPVGRYLVEADDSVERAGLLGLFGARHGLHGLHSGLGLLTGELAPREPLCTSFEILESMPWVEKHVRGWLRGRDGGIVEVKTRGGAVNTDALQKRLRGDGATAFSVFVLRLGRPLVAFVTRRVATA